MTKGKKRPYRYLDHTADIGCEVSGKTRRQLFEYAAGALFSLITPHEDVREEEERILEVSGMDEVDLWVNYLRELLSLVNGDGFIGRSVRITHLGKKNMRCVVRGEKLDYRRHRPVKEVKAVTYHGARVERTPSGWRGRFICDI